MVPREAIPPKFGAPTPLRLVERAYAAVRERLHEEGCRSLETGKWAVAIWASMVLATLWQAASRRRLYTSRAART